MKPAAAAPASLNQSGPKSVPYGKGAGVRVPPGTSTGPIYMEDKAGGTGKPPAAGTEPAAPSKPPAASPKAPVKARCREDVVEAFRRDEIVPLRLGKFAFEWIADQPDRTEELKAIKKLLVARQLASASLRLDHSLCVYCIAQRLGWDEAQNLRLSAIRNLRRLFAPNKAEGTWEIRRGLVDATEALWKRMVAEGLYAHRVLEEALKIRPEKPAKTGGVNRELVKVLKQVRRDDFSNDDLDAIIRACHDRKANRVPAAEVYKRAA
jgi:hypothetical protein